MIELTAAQTTLAAALALDITERRRQELRKKITPYPRTVSILSDIGECDRQMVYSITHWQERPLHDEDLQARFDAGKLQESELIRELEGLRYDIRAGQEVVEIKNRAGETIARGRIDGKIRYQGILIPFEVKSMNPMVFNSVEFITDFERKPWLRKYLRQLQSYLYGNNAEGGLLICTDCLGHWKLFVVTLDFGFAEQILGRLERVHEAVKENKLPDRIDYREEICGKCPFAQICLADIIRTEAEVLTSEDLITRLESREHLKEAKSTYEELDKGIKDEIKKAGISKGIAGNFLISVKTSETKERVIPAGIMTRVDISRLMDRSKI